jgi:hypothetical protein
MRRYRQNDGRDDDYAHVRARVHVRNVHHSVRHRAHVQHDVRGNVLLHLKFGIEIQFCVQVKAFQIQHFGDGNFAEIDSADLRT